MTIAELRINFGSGAYAATKVSGFWYIRADYGTTVPLSVNSTNFKMPDQNTGTTATIKTFALCYNGSAWGVVFDNGYVANFKPVEREDWSTYTPFENEAYFAETERKTDIAVDSDTETQNPVSFSFETSRELDTLEKANAWLQAQYTAGTPVEVACPLVQPVEYQFPERYVYTVLGANTFSADAGTLAMKYYADPGLLYEKIRAALAALGKNI